MADSSVASAVTVATETSAADPVDPDEDDVSGSPGSSAAPGDPVGGFEQVVPGGDCQCADGSEYSFYVRDADPERVLLYFQGGGACFTAETCAFATGSYKSTTTADDAPVGRAATGIFDLDAPDNPFAGYSIVFVPYCTGDVFLGDRANDYGNGVVVEHRGFVNATAAFDEMVRRFPDATEIFVTGSSAGGIPSPLFAGLAADAYPQARVTGLADAAGAYPDVAGVNAFIGGVWGSLASVPAWGSTADVTQETWSIPGLFTRAGLEHPDLVLARYDNAYDRVQATFAALAGVGADDLLTLIDANEAAVEAAGVDLDAFVAPGTDHTVLMSPEMYSLEVEGTRFVDWLTDLVVGTPVDDVRCVTCR